MISNIFKFTKKKRRTLSVVLLSLGIYTLINYSVARVYVSPPRKTAGDPPPGFIDTIFPCNNINMPIWVTQSLYEGKPKGNLVYVLVHGYRNCRKYWLDIARSLSDQGNEVVVTALRGHDSNNYPHTCYGIDESKDVAKLIDWVHQQYKNAEAKIILVGTSLGGATCWLASEIESRVHGIVSDGTFIDAFKSGDRWLANAFVAGDIFFKPMPHLTQYLIGRSMKDASPIRAALKWRGKPCLIIHSEKDHLVTNDESNYLAKLCGGDVWTVKEVGHVEGALKNKDDYTQKLIEFGKRVRN